MPKLSQLADALTKIAGSEPAPAPVPVPSEPEPEPEEVAAVPEIDETTRRAREWCKKMMPHLIYADEMTPKQLERALRERRKAMYQLPQTSWIYPNGRRGR